MSSPQTTEMPGGFDSRELRNVLGSFVTGVTVITTCDGSGKGHGVTANSFSSVSLEPPLVLWSQSVNSKSHAAFRDSEHFAVHILAEDQVALSNHFAVSRDDKFVGIAHDSGIGGAPLLQGCAGYLECKKVAAYPGGDHVVFLGRVQRIAHSPRRPLAFSGGKYAVAYAHDLGTVSLDTGVDPLAQIEAVRIATGLLPEICERVGQRTLCLAVWGNHGPTALRWQPSARPVSQNLRTGLVMSISRSATGRAFAAFLPEQITQALIQDDLRSSRASNDTEQAQRDRFERHLAEARLHGLGRATEAKASPLHQVAVNAFSAPVFDPHGMMTLALSLTCESTRLDPDWDGPIPRALKEAAGDISQRLAEALAA